MKKIKLFFIFNITLVLFLNDKKNEFKTFII